MLFFYEFCQHINAEYVNQDSETVGPQELLSFSRQISTGMVSIPVFFHMYQQYSLLFTNPSFILFLFFFFFFFLEKSLCHNVYLSFLPTVHLKVNVVENYRWINSVGFFPIFWLIEIYVYCVTRLKNIFSKINSLSYTIFTFRAEKYNYIVFNSAFCYEIKV